MKGIVYIDARDCDSQPSNDMPEMPKVAQLVGGRTQVTLPVPRRDYYPISVWHSARRREPLRVFDHRGRIVGVIRPGKTARFVALPPWWVRRLPDWLRRMLAGDEMVWEEAS